MESRVEGVAKVEAVARDKTRVPQGDMFNILLIIPSPLAQVKGVVEQAPQEMAHSRANKKLLNIPSKGGQIHVWITKCQLGHGSNILMAARCLQ